MEYPAWYVPLITSPMLIAMIAIVHVIVAQFAVGFGFLVTDMVRRAGSQNSVATLACLRQLSRAFILISVVFGAVTGVGIWWIIGLTSPETTGALIHIFVFGWASEWAVFVVEIVAAFVFYYYWERLDRRRHLTVGVIYAVAAWLSLVIISAVTSFMLTSGGWTPQDSFFQALFNPSFLPQTLLRSGGSFAIAALVIAFLVSWRPEADRVKNDIIRWASQWALFGMSLIFLGGIWYFLMLPDYVRLNLIRAPILLAMLTINFGVTMLVMGAFALGSFSGARWINPPSALLMLLVGMVAIASGEFVREGGRKPYRIDNLIFGPGIWASDVAKFHDSGFIANARWLQADLKRKIPQFDSQHIDKLSIEEQRIVGKGIFRYHCAACHADIGYNGIIPLVQPWNAQFLRKSLHDLHLANPAMPPWFGNEAEREALVQYLIPFTRQGGKQ